MKTYLIYITLIICCLGCAIEGPIERDTISDDTNDVIDISEIQDEDLIEDTKNDNNFDFEDDEPIPDPAKPDPIPEPKDIKAPQIISSTITNGEIDVDYTQINRLGKIVLNYDEVLGKSNVKIFSVGNRVFDMGWQDTISQKQLILVKNQGAPLDSSKVYKIKGAVEDRARNRSEVIIEFVTKIKE